MKKKGLEIYILPIGVKRVLFSEACVLDML